MKVEYDVFKMCTIIHNATRRQNGLSPRKVQKKKAKMKQRTDRMIDLNQTISIITLSVNSSNISISHRRKKTLLYAAYKKYNLNMKHE